VIVIGLGWCLDWLGLLGLFAGGFDMDWIVIQFFVNLGLLIGPFNLGQLFN
jgi:hypothetical protein